MAYPVNTDLKTYLSISGSGDDAFLTTVINGAIDFCEDYTGRVFVAGNATRYFPVELPYVDASGRVLWLRDDLVTISSLVVGGVTIPGADYFLTSITGIAPYRRLKLYGGSSYRLTNSDGKTPIAVTGAWGYSADVPASVRLAMLQLGAYYYRSRSTGPGGAVSVGSRRGGVVIEASEVPENILDALIPYEKTY